MESYSMNLYQLAFFTCHNLKMSYCLLNHSFFFFLFWLGTGVIAKCYSIAWIWHCLYNVHLFKKLPHFFFQSSCIIFAPTGSK